MKLEQILTESMDMWVPDAPRNSVKRDCWACDGTGEKMHIDTPYICDYCDGEKTIEEEESEAPEMNLSNSNMIALMNSLGYESDYGYRITPEEIPDLKRKIISNLNNDKNISPHTREPSDSQEFRGMRQSNDEYGNPSISPDRGPRMISPGRDTSYFKDKYKRMLEILDYAQKNNMKISVG